MNAVIPFFRIIPGARSRRDKYTWTMWAKHDYFEYNCKMMTNVLHNVRSTFANHKLTKWSIHEHRIQCFKLTKSININKAKIPVAETFNDKWHVKWPENWWIIHGGKQFGYTRKVNKQNPRLPLLLFIWRQQRGGCL